MELFYKNADINDAETLIDIYDSAFYDDYILYGECPAYGRSVENMEQSVLEFPKVIAYDQGKAVGVISYKPEGAGKYYIGCLAVKKEEQGKGIGTALMRHFLDEHYTERFGFDITGEENDGHVKVLWFRLSR